MVGEPMDGVPAGRWLCGKLPSLGDFVQRGLLPAARDRIDGWLSDEIDSARNAMGDLFEDAYDAAPAWTFVDRHEEGGWSGGALCASIDRAGRRFPLVMASPAADAAEAALVSVACLDAMHQAFVGGEGPDWLHAVTLSPVEVPWQPENPEWALLAEDGPALSLPGSWPSGAIRRMCEIAGDVA